MNELASAIDGGRTPQGVRGLKQDIKINIPVPHLSHSARSAWIETPFSLPYARKTFVALRKECVD